MQQLHRALRHGAIEFLPRGATQLLVLRGRDLELLEDRLQILRDGHR